jgi:hypothetical protein
VTNDNYQGGPSADNYGIGVPPPELPPTQDERETSYERPAYERPAYERATPERHQPPSYVRWIGGCLIVFTVLFVLCGGTTAVLAVMSFNSTPARASFDKSFSVNGVPTLVIHGDAGGIHINAGGDGQVSVHATKQVRALTHAQAQIELDAITITATQSGNVVTIQANSDDYGPHIFRDRQIDLNLTTPANTNLTVVENAGSLDATGLTGKVMAQVNAGSVTMDTMTLGTGSSLRVNAGSLIMNGLLQSGASLTVNVNAGSADLTLPRNTSARIDASASAGNIDVNGWNISVNHNAANATAFGDLNPNPTGVITIRVNAGSATLNAA